MTGGISWDYRGTGATPLVSAVVALALSLGAGSSEVSAAVQIAAWNFNGAQGTLEPSTGQGTAATVGGTSGTFSAGDPTDDGSTKPAENKAWNIASFAAQGSGSGERGVRFDVSTAGQGSLSVSWRERHSNSASRFVQFQYSLDGTTFTSTGLANDGIFEASLGGEVWQPQRTVDLSSITGVADNAKFAARIVSVFAPGTSGYAATAVGGNYSAAGTIRFDLVAFSGTPVPTPAAAGLGVASGVLALGGGRRRD